ncbi:MAG: hypothetical protein ACLSB9_33825 [Hydrogeniiclostridium mannosilyticum]
MSAALKNSISNQRRLLHLAARIAATAPSSMPAMRGSPVHLRDLLIQYHFSLIFPRWAAFGAFRTPDSACLPAPRSTTPPRDLWPAWTACGSNTLDAAAIAKAGAALAIIPITLVLALFHRQAKENRAKISLKRFSFFVLFFVLAPSLPRSSICRPAMPLGSGKFTHHHSAQPWANTNIVSSSNRRKAHFDRLLLLGIIAGQPGHADSLGIW